MNKSIKIGLIALAVLVIGLVLVLTLSTPPEIAQLSIGDSYFVSQVSEQCKADIDSATSFDHAQTSFNTMLQDVNDAAYLENIEEGEAADCKKLLAMHFAPVLATQADTAFARSNWNEEHINSLRADAQTILGGNVLPEGSEHKTKLNAIVKNVNDYHAAKALLAKAGTCTTQAQVNGVIAQASAFKRAPLNNCTSLVSSLNAVPGKARTALAAAQAAAAQRQAAQAAAAQRQRAAQAAAQQRQAQQQQQAQEQQTRNRINSDNGNEPTFVF